MRSSRTRRRPRFHVRRSSLKGSLITKKFFHYSIVWPLIRAGRGEGARTGVERREGHGERGGVIVMRWLQRQRSAASRRISLSLFHTRYSESKFPGPAKYREGVYDWILVWCGEQIESDFGRLRHRSLTVAARNGAATVRERCALRRVLLCTICVARH